MNIRCWKKTLVLSYESDILRLRIFANLQELKMTKRDSLMVHIKWFYRTSEVPEQVYQLLIQDRRTEHGQIEAHPPTRSKGEKKKRKRNWPSMADPGVCGAFF